MGVVLRVVRSLADLDAGRDAGRLGALEGELVDRFVPAGMGAGFTNRSVAEDRRTLTQFTAFLGRGLWAVQPADVDAWLAGLRGQGLARATVYDRANTLARFYAFVIARYQQEVQARTGWAVVQPVDEFNRPRRPHDGRVRVPPTTGEVAGMFNGWRAQVVHTRKYLPAVRNYVMASLWRRAGLRINESVMPDIADWYRDLGGFGKLHVRFGKGSVGRGPKARLVPGIDVLLACWPAGLVARGDPPSFRRRPAGVRCAHVPQRAPDAARPVGPGGRAASAGRPRSGGQGPSARMGGPVAPARPAAFLRLVPVRAGRGSEGDPGAARARVAGHHERLHPRTQRAHRAGVDAGEQPGCRPPGRRCGGDAPMRWELRSRALERGITTSAALRRILAAHGLSVSVGKMSGLWSGTPLTIRLQDLEVICTALACRPSDLLVPQRHPACHTVPEGNCRQAAADSLKPAVGRTGRTTPVGRRSRSRRTVRLVTGARPHRRTGNVRNGWCRRCDDAPDQEQGRKPGAVRGVPGAAAGDAAGGVLLHLLARRPGHPAAVSALRFMPPVLGIRVVRALPSGCDPATGFLHELLRLGRDPHVELAVQRLRQLALQAVPQPRPLHRLLPPRIPGCGGNLPTVPQAGHPGAPR